MAGLEAWDRWAFDGDGGLTLHVRLQGEFVAYAKAMLNTREQAEDLLAEIETLLAGRPVPIPGHPAEAQQEFVFREVDADRNLHQGVTIFARDLSHAKRLVEPLQMFTGTTLTLSTRTGVRLSERSAGAWHDAPPGA